jgi:hypothetical protein
MEGSVPQSAFRWRPSRSLLTGAAAGAATWLLLMAMLLSGLDPSLLIGFALVVLYVLAGMLLLAAPAWALVHRSGHRRLGHAVGLGLVLGLVVGLALSSDLLGLRSPSDPVTQSFLADDEGAITIGERLTGYGWWVSAQAAGLVAVAAGVIGATLHRISRRPPNPPHRD